LRPCEVVTVQRPVKHVLAHTGVELYSTGSETARTLNPYLPITSNEYSENLQARLVKTGKVQCNAIEVLSLACRKKLRDVIPIKNQRIG
jgi:hypothetical protein